MDTQRPHGFALRSLSRGARPANGSHQANRTFSIERGEVETPMRKPRHLTAGSVAAHRSSKARAEAKTFVHLVERNEMSTGEVMALLHVTDSNGEGTSLRGKANAFRKEVARHFAMLTRKE
jgi:hypothetical protein